MFADRIRRCISRGNDEQGSMVIALLAVIVTSGLMISITAATVQGHASVRFDRDHVRVVQGADAGVEEVLFRVGHPDPAQRLVPNSAMTPAASSGATPTATGDGSSYSWEVLPWTAEAGAWQVNSQATLNGETRSVSAIIAQPKPFQLAAFADSHLVLRGANSANSYNASTWNTLEGDVGSNGTITLNGNVVADDAHLHNYDALPDPARCTSNGNTVCAGADRVGPKTDVTSAEALGFIDDAVATCPLPIVAFTGTTLEAREAPYCFTTMNLGADFTVTGTGNAIVYLTNATTETTFGVTNKVKVNCALCTGTGGPRPDAAKLQIFTKAVGPVRIGNHTHVAASIFAPNASCGGNYSNAGANFYGSMVCRIVSNQGAWSFHYDDRLKDVGAGGWTVKRWSEG